MGNSSSKMSLCENRPLASYCNLADSGPRGALTNVARYHLLKNSVQISTSQQKPRLKYSWVRWPFLAHLLLMLIGPPEPGVYLIWLYSNSQKCTDSLFCKLGTQSIIWLSQQTPQTSHHWKFYANLFFKMFFRNVAVRFLSSNAPTAEANFSRKGEISFQPHLLQPIEIFFCWFDRGHKILNVRVVAYLDFLVIVAIRNLIFKLVLLGYVDYQLERRLPSRIFLFSLLSWVQQSWYPWTKKRTTCWNWSSVMRQMFHNVR